MILIIMFLFLFFPVLRRGSGGAAAPLLIGSFLFFPVLRRGSGTLTGVSGIGLFLFFPVLRRGSTIPVKCFIHISFYSSPSCDGDRNSFAVNLLGRSFYSSPSCDGDPAKELHLILWECFYSSPSCDGDRSSGMIICHRLCFYSSPSCDGDHSLPAHRSCCNVSILPRLATGIKEHHYQVIRYPFLFFPVLRRGSQKVSIMKHQCTFLFFPVLRRGSIHITLSCNSVCFYSSPSCDGDHLTGIVRPNSSVSILPRLATGIPRRYYRLV